MSRVIFMCDPSGSGKSTYARRLEGAGMVRLSFDVYVLGEELAAHHFDHVEPPTADEGPLVVVGQRS